MPQPTRYKLGHSVAKRAATVTAQTQETMQYDGPNDPDTLALQLGRGRAQRQLQVRAPQWRKAP